MKLIVKHETGIIIPATHNGLGYNNLIYISLLLAKMQKDASGDYLGSNSKTFPILAIEEPEAHLHPAMQYKFLKFLYENKKEKAKQIFITTHSPNITAAVNLDNIICFNRDDKGKLNVAYLGKAFTDSEADSKAYVQRFLDATKSDMLFSKKVILVEGITEQLLLPLFANYENKCFEDEHVSVINIGGRYFKHFLKLFDSERLNAINKKIACITDLDPIYTINDQIINEKCYPFENRDGLIEFKECSNSLVDDYAESKHANIRSFSQQKGVGKTLEYAIALEELNHQIRLKLELHNKAFFQKQQHSRYDLLQQEKPYLKSLPGNQFELKHCTEAKVQKNYHVTLGEDWHHYSVPYQYIGKQIKIIYDTSVVEVFHNHQRIALHKRNYRRNAYTTTDAHMPEKHLKYSITRGYDPDYFISKAASTGDACAQVITILLESRQFTEQTYNACLGILRLVSKYTAARVEAACRRALQGSSISYKTISNILASNLDKLEAPASIQTTIPLHDNIRGSAHYTNN